MESLLENNKVNIIGKFVSGFTSSLEVAGEVVYRVDVAVKRLSGQTDVIPLMIPERLIDMQRDYRGCDMETIGQFCSYNRHEGIKKRLILFVSVQEINFVDEFTDCRKNNQILLDGYLCKNPIYRKTPLGREIVDLLLAVNQPSGKSDYIPCIAWGRNARFASEFKVGTRLRVWGRIQSREYVKRLSENECENRVAYEVSASGLETV